MFIFIVLASILTGVGISAAFGFAASALNRSIAGTIPPVAYFTTPATDSTWWVGAESRDSSAMSNTGVQASIQVISFPSTGCLAFWVADGLTNGVWGQVGYYLCDGDSPVAFYQIWNLNTYTILSGGTQGISAGTHVFSMYLQGGTTWAYALDGTVFGTYAMGASLSSSTYPVEALSEEQGASVFSFPAVTFTTAMQAMNSNSWSPVRTGVSYGSAYGVQGTLQNSVLQNDAIIIGGSISSLPYGTPVWSSSSSTATATTSSTIATTSSTIATTSSTIATTSSTTSSSTTTATTSSIGSTVATSSSTVATSSSTVATSSSTTSSSSSATSTSASGTLSTLSFGTPQTSDFAAIADAINPAVSTADMTMDGSASTGCGYVTACSVSLTTTQSNDVVIVGCDCYGGGAWSVKDAAGLTFTPRSGPVQVGGGQWLETWYAISPSALTADKVSIQTTSTGETWYGMTAFAVSGANIAQPFVAGFPEVQPYTNDRLVCASPCNVGVLVPAGAFVFQVGGDTGDKIQTAGLGMTLIQSSERGEDLYSQYEVVPS
ncbi:MAG: hypothetical protein OK449_04645 [Thaumarchaeota archaeon]|nr:hypothetical protein [Nitrososphaerota archaeon]